jgi:flagellar basal-body rod protein FlgC
MGMFGAMEASGSGLSVFRTWIEATANNIANTQSIGQAPGADPYRTEKVIAHAGSADGEDFGAHVTRIVKADDTDRPKYEPDHPFADPVTGEVKYPGVDMGEEMVNMVVAQRGYQANVTALQYARDAYQAALRLGR